MSRPWSKPTVQIHDMSFPTSPFSFSSFKDIQNLCAEEPSQPTATAKKTSAIFHRVRVANSLLRAWSTRPPALTQPPKDESLTTQSEPSSISIPGAEKRIVVYSTSLRVVRRTFEDCMAVRSIVQGFRVTLDERDLAMDHGFITELQQILGQRKLTLPRVFNGGDEKVEIGFPWTELRLRWRETGRASVEKTKSRGRRERGYSRGKTETKKKEYLIIIFWTDVAAVADSNAPCV